MPFCGTRRPALTRHGRGKHLQRTLDRETDWLPVARQLGSAMQRIIEIPDLAATETLGRRFGALLFPGAVIALVGQLGAGKTHLTRAIAEGLGVKNPAAVNSPTFVLIQEYPARMPIYHFDTYRLSGPAEFAELGVEEYFRGEGVCLVEWADRVHAVLPEEYLRIEIEIVDEDRRRFHVTAIGEQYATLLARLVGPAS